MKTVSRRYRDSSSFKMALLFTVLLAAAGGMLGFALFDFGRRDFLRETEAAINSEINMLASLARLQPAAIPGYIAQRAADDAVVRFRYEDEAGKLLGGTIDPMPRAVQTITEGVLRFSLTTEQGQQSFAAKIHTFADGSRLLVARNVHSLIASHDRLNYLSALIIALMLAVVLVSFGISHFVVNRINRIAALAQRIVETGDLTQRIAIDSRWDDLSNLAAVLNGFLDRIETLMAGIREVSNNIAHDLRTPLSGLRSDLESLKGRPVDDQAIDALLADADRILALFQALLRIANIEKGVGRPLAQAVDLAAVIGDVAELYEPLADERAIRLAVTATPGLTVRGDGDALFQMFANLVDNAIKFSPAAAEIALQACRDADRITVRISDRGPGIPAAEKDKVFKHFYRGDASRSTAGNGLGLSLVKAVAALHQASIRLEDARPGLCVRLDFKPYE